MLSKDSKAKDAEGEKKQKTLEEICQVTARIETPRMLSTVVEVLPRQSVTYQHLQNILGKQMSTFIILSNPAKKQYWRDQSLKMKPIFSNQLG